MSNIIDSIQLSGTVYTIQGTGGGGSPTVELTQAEYDALVSAGTVSANTYYIITDATAGDLTQYWTSAQTQSAITQATSGKVNTSSVVNSVTSASTDLEIPTAKAVYDAIPTGGGGSITIDPSLDSGSTNAVANSAVSAALNHNNMFLYRVDPVRTWDGHPTGKLQLRWRNPYNGNTATTQDSIALLKINNIPLIEDYVSGISNLNLVETSAITTSVTSASTDAQVPSAKAVWEAASGGGTTYTAGRGIDITNDTISVSLPISAGTGTNALVIASDTYDISNKAKGAYSVCLNGGGYHPNYAYGAASLAEGMDTKAYGNACHSEGHGSKAGVENNFNIQYAHAEGESTQAKGTASHAEGICTIANNQSEHASGKFNVSNTGSTDADKTLFSVGNGTANNARHNAFEIRQNGDIYLTSGGTDIKLQDHLGGGGSSINVVQTTGSSTTDVMSQDAVTTQLSGYVTTDTSQDITGTKTFVGEKKIKFKQSGDSNKLGFTLYNSASTNNEIATFEFRPNTYTDSSSVSHPLLYIGHYRNTNTANAGVAQTMVGFRQYDQKGAAAYHYLMPLPAEAKTPFSLTTSFKNYFAPLGFKNGSTMITTDNTGVADFSSVLGGLKLVKLSQSDYDALTTKDDNTVYFIGDSTNGYTMKIGSANVN